jgi:menaquinone-dependent protoporphyrinogen oxidase
MMRSVLVVYGTGDGQTEKIARYIAHRLDVSGVPVVLVNAASGVDPDPAQFGSVIVAASVHAGGYQRAVRKWVGRHVDQLNRMRTAFVSVCLGVLEHNPATDRDLARIMTDFFDRTHWHPATREIVAGALKYTHYNPLKRWVMRRIVRKTGSRDLDTTRDYEYTNWDGVAAFVSRFCTEPVSISGEPVRKAVA